MSVLGAVLATGFLAAGCGPGTPSDTDTDASDAKPPMDAMMDSNPPVDTMPPLPKTHLLITEISLRTPEFIEIYNPGLQTEDLSNYYIADRPEYERFPAALGTTTAPVTPTDPSSPYTVDFIARFPAGATIAPGEAMVITIVDDAIADFVVRSATGTKAMLDLPAGGKQYIPLLTALSSGGLTNGGEGIVLFFWDGLSDTVKDVDMVAFEGTSVSNSFAAKTSAILVDGPDTGATPTPYKTDAFTMTKIATAHVDGESHKRIALEDGNETQQGNGNGVVGHDETTENIAVTWDAAGTYTAPTPGDVPATLKQPTP